MIADKNLQLASNASITATGATPGYQILPNYIDLTQLRSFGSGCPLYAQITIRSDFASVGSPVEVVEWRLKGSNVPVLPGSAEDVPAFEILYPTLGTTGQVTVAALTAGKKVTMAINPFNFFGLTAGTLHDARGVRYVYASMLTFDSTTGGLIALNGGTFDFDFVLESAAGVQVAGANKQYDGPYYPTNITRV
jgi:hypothetical protein